MIQDKTLFVIYDARAILGSTDDAHVFCCADTLREARRDAKEFGADFGGAAIYQYDIGPGNELVNERLIEAVVKR